MKYVLAAVALVAALSASVVLAQTAGVAIIAQGSDGTLYLVGHAGRYTLSPTTMSDDELAALPDLGPISGDLSGPHPNLPSDQPQTLTGQGTLNTLPVSLQGGNYTVDWVASGAAGKACTHGAFLQPVATGSTFYGETIGRGDAPAGAAAHGETQVYNLPAGQYFVDATSTCGWSITIAPQH